MNFIVLLTSTDPVETAVGFKDVLNWIYQHVLEIIVFISIFIEITPIKISPITWLMGLFYKPIRKDIKDMSDEINAKIDNVKTDLDNVKTDLNNVKTDLRIDIDNVKTDLRVDIDSEKSTIDELVKTMEMTEISRIRWEILEFSNSIENGQLHIRDEYRHIIDDNRRYHTLRNKYELDNEPADDEEFSKIQAHYEHNRNTTSVYF